MGFIVTKNDIDLFDVFQYIIKTAENRYNCFYSNNKINITITKEKELSEAERIQNIIKWQERFKSGNIYNLIEYYDDHNSINDFLNKVKDLLFNFENYKEEFKDYHYYYDIEYMFEILIKLYEYGENEKIQPLWVPDDIKNQ